MRTVLKVLAVLVVGTVLGLAATWFTVIRGAMAGGVKDGPWRTSLEAGSNEGNMYLRAAVAVHGFLALNRHETMYYTANTDSEGVRLDSRCTYRVKGNDPKTRWWSITAYGIDDYLIPNAQHRYSVSKNSVARDPDGSFSVMLSRNDGGENWIPLVRGLFSISLRLYNPDPGVAADPAHVVLPIIEREVC
ncbi:MAG TPA: DUF1214 domain-containing protein [Rhizomicrobium sp.]|jgi:hypothetical protein